MDKYMTISEVSRQFQISARMLRHYEKLGLIASARREDYAYRTYDQEAVKRVRQIIILRKLQIPLKKIKKMMGGTREDAVLILEERLRDMDESLETAETMRRALNRLLELLREETGDPTDTLNGHEAEELVRLLPMEKHRLKEEKTMSAAKEMIEKG
ncbi:MAG: MerR family transcriptional regulator, partial [Oscillospiraceae bacterium]|nr:MerR family transcriptional regulator [Oscillospiraceae bacterium]